MCATGNVGDFYERAEIQLYQSFDFQVVLEAVVGDGYQGDIAIDDVTFTPDCIPTGKFLPRLLKVQLVKDVVLVLSGRYC